MARIPRYQLDGLFHHVTVRGTGGIYLFVDDPDRAYFVPLLRSSIDRFRWICHAWCLMGTHYHLVVEAPTEQLSRGMHRLNTLYAMYFNDRHGRRGRLFENRFASWLIRDEAHLQAACWYVLHNPVAAGLCRSAEEWSWGGLGGPS